MPIDLKKIGGGEENRRISLEDCRKPLEKTRVEELIKSNSLVIDEKDETQSTDSNSTAADDSDTKKKNFRLFRNFRKNKSKPS